MTLILVLCKCTIASLDRTNPVSHTNKLQDHAPVSEKPRNDKRMLCICYLISSTTDPKDNYGWMLGFPKSIGGSS